ncbi:hypothetical protein B0H14DRAFT_2886941 [Mycena olivaceomarginata]|nr:hypothetical protein B0H14DRAFT_2886941 [Mycena olivaceomarginata]
MDALEPQAIEWLKSARYKLMRDVEEALDPTQSLYLQAQVPPVLELFRAAITKNLEMLLRDCGFQVRAPAYPSLGWVAFTIHFPAQLAAPPQALRTLHVEDEFSARPAGRGGGGGRKRKRGGAGSFAAGNFARLLIEARGGSAANTVNTEEEDEDEDNDDQGVKDEEDEDQGRRRRLRSTTRASSAATLRSDPDTGGRLRGGNRKSRRVKKEEEE